MECQILFSEKNKKIITDLSFVDFVHNLLSFNPFYLFVLRFYGPVNPMGSCLARSVYLTTRLMGRLSPLSG